MAKRDLASAVSAAANAGDQLIQDRLDRTEDLLKLRPTGFAPPVATKDSTASGAKDDHPVSDRGVYHAIIPIEKIDENPFNARRIYRQERIEKLAVSIASKGQMVPGMATIRGGRVILVAGHYRLRSIHFSGGKVMEVMVHPDLTDRQMYELSLKENSERDDQTAYDNALAWRDLLDKKVFPSEESLVEVTGFSAANISKTLSILKMSEGVLDAIKQNPSAIGLSIGYELGLLEKVAGPTVAMEVVQGVFNEEYSRKDIQDIRRRYEESKTRKKRETSRQNYRILSGDKEIGSIKDFGDGRVILNVTLDDHTERTRLMDLLTEHFKVS